MILFGQKKLRMHISQVKVLRLLIKIINFCYIERCISNKLLESVVKTQWLFNKEGFSLKKLVNYFKLFLLHFFAVQHLRQSGWTDEPRRLEQTGSIWSQAELKKASTKFQIFQKNFLDFKFTIILFLCFIGYQQCKNLSEI